MPPKHHERSQEDTQLVQVIDSSFIFTETSMLFKNSKMLGATFVYFTSKKLEKWKTFCKSLADILKSDFASPGI